MISKEYMPIDIEKSVQDSRDLIMPHQSEAVKAMTNYFQLDRNIPGRTGLVVMPTGSGKTYTAVTWLLKEGVARGYRIVWLVHRQELVQQTFNEFRQQAPLLKGTGIKTLRVLPVSDMHLKMSAARRADIYVCSIPSVANKNGFRSISGMLGVQGKDKVIAVIDEAHHAVSASYQKVLNRIRKLNPNMVLLGLTATPFRMSPSDQAFLQAIFNVDINIRNHIGRNGFVYEVTLKELLATGFLANPVYEKVNTHLIGEIEYECSPEDEEFFNKFHELSERLKARIGASPERNRIIVKQYLSNRKRYGKTIIFAVNQMGAKMLCKEFQNEKVECEYAISDRPDSQDVINRFKNNEFEVLINVQMLTEGSDIPDTQTIFLTRQTNSDSLLMQMIGRGLRGPKAKGTKTAYIVAFHDTWNTFAHWLDPGTLDVFADDLKVNFEEEKLARPEIIPAVKEETIADEEHCEEEETVLSGREGLFITEEEIYIKLYNSVRASMSLEAEPLVIPVGWYSVVEENGEDFWILVYEEQLPCYEDMKRNCSLIVNKVQAEVVLDLYFSEVRTKPSIEEISLILEYMNDTGDMPHYFPFEVRDALDPVKIAGEMERQFKKDEDREAWLKSVFEGNQMLRKMYRHFFEFKKTVFNAVKEPKQSELAEEDDREQYHIVPDYHNLTALLSEVLEMYPKLNAEGLLKISWSRRVVRSYFGKYIPRNENSYEIIINVLLSSPDVDPEVIKYLIFHELLHANGYLEHNEEFRLREWQYPDSVELDSFLDSIGLKYNLDGFRKLPVSNKEPEIKDKAEKEIVPVFNDKAAGIAKGFKYCRFCGKKLPEETTICENCGGKLEY